MQAKSKENWEIGLRCLAENKINVAASRLYYGLFQAVLWYARVKKGYPCDKTSDIHTRIQNDIVRNDFGSGERFDKRMRRTFNEFRTFRETADYAPDPPQPDEIREYLNDGELLREHYLSAAMRS